MDSSAIENTSMALTWLVTGAGGFLGSYVCRALLARGQSVIGQAREHRPRKSGIVVVNADFEVLGAGQALIREYDPDRVVHCAALTNVDMCERDPDLAMRLNADLCGELADACQESGSRFIMISTDQLWSDPTPPIPESLPPDPLNVYGATKAEGERLAANCSDHLVVRTNFFGAGLPHRRSASDAVLDSLSEGRAYSGFSDVFFSPIEVGLLADLILDAADLPITGIFNVAGRDRVSKLEFARRLAAAANYDPLQISEGKIVDASLAARRPMEMALDCTRIEEKLGRAVPTLEKSISACLTTMRQLDRLATARKPGSMRNV